MKTLLKLAIGKLGFEKKHSRRKGRLDPFIAMRRLVTKQKPVIFDVGANTGQTAIRYRSLFPKAVIHCFEPFPASFDLLSASLAGDTLVELHRVALSDKSGSSKLNVNRSKATNSLLSSDQRASHYWGNDVLDKEDEIEVVTETVDNFCKQQNIEHVDIVKLDVQGAEYAVLSGAQEMLKRQSIDIVYMEMITAPTYVGQRKLHEYLAFFESQNYELFDFYNSVRKDGRLIQSDNIMVSSVFLERYERNVAK
jgi:FkbM family methyltransferase